MSGVGWRTAVCVALLLAVCPGNARALAASRIEVVPSIGHSGGTIAVSPDGARVVSARGKQIGLWDVATGRLIRSLGVEANVFAVAFSPNGKYILSAGFDSLIRLWATSNGQLIRKFDGHQSATNALAFSPDGSRIVSSGWDKELKLWDANSGELIHTIAAEGYVTAVAFSPDGTRVISGANNNLVKLWDARTGELIRVFQGHTSRIDSVAFLPDGSRIASTSFGDHALCLWETDTGKLLWSIGGKTHHNKSVSFSPDGQRILTTTTRALPHTYFCTTTLEVLDADDGQPVMAMGEPDLGHCTFSAAYSPDGAAVFSVGGDTLKLIAVSYGRARSPLANFMITKDEWSPAKGKLIRTFQGALAPITTIAISADGTRLITGAKNGQWMINDRTSDQYLHLWDARTGKHLLSFKGAAKGISSLAWLPDGQRFLSIGLDETLGIWDAASGELIRSLQPPKFGGSRLLPNGLSTLSIRWGNEIKLIDTFSGEPLRSIDGLSGVASAVSFSADSTRIIMATALRGPNGKKLMVWDAATGQLVGAFGDDPAAVHAVALSPDGRRAVAAGNRNSISVWDVASAQEVRRLDGHLDEVSALAFSPDGALVLSGSQDRTLKLWEVASGRLVHTFTGHTGTITSVIISPDGKRVISGGEDGSVRFWSVASGELLAMSLSGKHGQAITITPQGFFTYSGDASELVSIVSGLNVVSITELEHQLLRPDLVEAALNGDPSGAYGRAISTLKLEEFLAEPAKE